MKELLVLSESDLVEAIKLFVQERKKRRPVKDEVQLCVSGFDRFLLTKDPQVLNFGAQIEVEPEKPTATVPAPRSAWERIIENE